MSRIADQNCCQDIECTNLRVFLGDGSEGMLYTGQILLHCTIQQANVSPSKGKRNEPTFRFGDIRRRRWARPHSKSYASSRKSTTNDSSIKDLKSMGTAASSSNNTPQTTQKKHNTLLDTNQKVIYRNDDKQLKGVDGSNTKKGREEKPSLKDNPSGEIKDNKSGVNEGKNYAGSSKEDKDTIENSASHVKDHKKSKENNINEKIPDCPSAFSHSEKTTKNHRLSPRKDKKVESGGATGSSAMSTDILHKNVNSGEADNAIAVGKHSGIYGIYDDDDVVSMDKSTKSPTKRTMKTYDKRKEAEIRRTLLSAHSSCYEIQRFLIQLLLDKLKGFGAHPNDDHTIKELDVDDLDSLVFLLQSFLKCFDIQVGLNHSLGVLVGGDEGYEESEGFNVTDKEDKDELLVECRSLMNHTSFSKALVCTHLSNPYSPDLRYSCGEDRVFCAANQNFCIYLPHGEGKLESLSGKLIYQGQWKNGKRWGFGKAFILSGSELSASPKQFGMYEGSWWNNMRHGHGRFVFASSGEYNGGWQYDMMSGMGTMTYPDGSSFEGVWDEDEPDGCGIFLWPNGDAECRDCNKGQVQRSFRLRGKGQSVSPYNDSLRDYAILRIKYQSILEEKTQLLQMNSRLRDTAEQQSNQLTIIEERLKQRHDEDLKRVKQEMREVSFKKKLSFEQEHQEKLRTMKESHESKIQELEEKIGQVKIELEANKAAVICQICFDRARDCILMPCTHMLYCRVCISKEKREGRNRCPACRCSISGEITCNIGKQ